MSQRTDHSPSTFHLRRQTPGSFLLVPCPRIGRSIRCQGQLEAAAAVILAGCPLVVSLQEQPLSIWYAWRDTPAGVQIQLLDQRPRRRRIGEGRVSYVVPDFLVEMHDGRRRLVEVKPSQKLERPLVRRKLAVAQAFGLRQGWNFHVVTERHLFRGPLLSNLRLLARYRQARVEPQRCDELVRRLAGGSRTLGEILSPTESCRDPGALRTAALHLLAVGRLDFDPRAAPLTDSTLIAPGGSHPWDPFGSVWAPSGCSTDAPSGSSASPPPIGSPPAT